MTVRSESTMTPRVCAICGMPYEGFGHNPAPLLDTEKRVCSACNDMHVIPVRTGARQRIKTYTGEILECNHNS